MKKVIHTIFASLIMMAVLIPLSFAAEIPSVDFDIYQEDGQVAVDVSFKNAVELEAFSLTFGNVPVDHIVSHDPSENNQISMQYNKGTGFVGAFFMNAAGVDTFKCLTVYYDSDDIENAKVNVDGTVFYNDSKKAKISKSFNFDDLGEKEPEDETKGNDVVDEDIENETEVTVETEPVSEERTEDTTVLNTEGQKNESRKLQRRIAYTCGSLLIIGVVIGTTVVLTKKEKTAK